MAKTSDKPATPVPGLAFGDQSAGAGALGLFAAAAVFVVAIVFFVAESYFVAMLLVCSGDMGDGNSWAHGLHPRACHGRRPVR